MSAEDRDEAAVREDVERIRRVLIDVLDDTCTDELGHRLPQYSQAVMLTVQSQLLLSGCRVFLEDNPAGGREIVLNIMAALDQLLGTYGRARH